MVLVAGARHEHLVRELVVFRRVLVVDTIPVHLIALLVSVPIGARLRVVDRLLGPLGRSVGAERGAAGTTRQIRRHG